MSAETIAEILKILAGLPAEKAAQVRAILAEAGYDLRPRAEPVTITAGLILVLLLAVVVGIALAWAIVELINRR